MVQTTNRYVGRKLMIHSNSITYAIHRLVCLIDKLNCIENIYGLNKRILWTNSDCFKHLCKLTIPVPHGVPYAATWLKHELPPAYLHSKSLQIAAVPTLDWKI